MPRDYLPSRDGDLALWTANFAALSSASPGTYGLDAGQAATYAALNTDWQVKLAVSNDPSTRTGPTIAAKDAARIQVKQYTRQLAAQVQAFPTITPQLLSDLGLTIRSTGRTPQPPPVTFPLVNFLATAQGLITLSIRDENTPNARRIPSGVLGAQVFVKIGGAAPTGLEECAFIGLASRYPGQFQLPNNARGSQIWIIARWQNRKGDVGPISSVAGDILT